MDWQAFGAKIGLPTTGTMGDYYRPQIEEKMALEARRQQLVGNQPGYQPGGTGQVGPVAMDAGRPTQAQTWNSPGQRNPSVPPQQQALQQPMAQPAQPTQPPAQQFTGQTQNPYMGQMADEITRRASTQFNQQINPAIRRAAIANGGYGGSAQGIAQGLAASQGMDNVAGQLTNLYGTQFNADRGYGLQSDALDLNIYNANQGWMNQGQQNQLNTLDKLLGWNQTYGIGNATAAQNTPLNYWQQFNQGAQGLGGMGQTGTQNLQGNPWLGALGGALTGGQIWKSFGG